MGATAEGCISTSLPWVYPYWTMRPMPTSPNAAVLDVCCTPGIKRRLTARNLLKPQRAELPQVKGLKVCRQADGRWVREFKRSENASGEPVFWLTGAFESAKPIHPDNDMLALDSGYASLVPCKIDVTDYDFMATLNNWIL
mgnify:FL=1